MKTTETKEWITTIHIEMNGDDAKIIKNALDVINKSTTLLMSPGNGKITAIQRRDAVYAISDCLGDLRELLYAVTPVFV